jgi:hypothetical protein
MIDELSEAKNRIACGPDAFDFDNDPEQILILHNPSVFARQYFSFAVPQSSL